jgi:hypothetical protein
MYGVIPVVWLYSYIALYVQKTVLKCTFSLFVLFEGFITVPQNEAVLLYFREVPGSNIGHVAGYPDWSFSWFFSQTDDGMYLRLGHDRF